MSLSYSRDAILDSLYVGGGGLRLTDSRTDLALAGTIRFNTSNNFFEGYTGVTGPLGETWRSLLLEIASPTVLGGVKVGSNLTISSQGVLSSVAIGESRIFQNVITVSKNVGSADYTTINGAIVYINDLIISSNPNKPTLENPFKIIVSPGVYEEHLTLPDYVSLEGEGSNLTIIRRLDGADNVEDGALIIMGEGSRLENLELQNYQSGNDCSSIVYANHKSNLIFSNLKIVMGNNLYAAGLDVIGLYFTDCGSPILDNLTIDIIKGTNLIFGFFFDQTNPIIFNTKITIDTNSNNSYCSNHESNSNGEYRNCDLTVKNSLNNIALKNANTTPYLNNCNLIAEKNLTNSNSKAYGIYNESNTFYKTLTNNNISFTSNLSTNERDFINLPTTSGFKKDYYIQVLGSSSDKNNSLFLVEDILSNKLILPINKLETQSAIAGTTINQYYTLKVDYCFVKGTNSSIFSTPGNSSYVIKGEKSTFVGSQFDPLLNNGLFLINNYNSITVSTDGGDFRNLSTAINSIQNANEFNRYVIIVKTGIYTEPDDTFIEMKPYVNIIGSGRDTTIINFNRTGSNPNSSCAILLSSNIEISDITFNNESQITSSDDNRTVICGQNVSDVNLKRVGLNNVGPVEAQNIGINLFGCTDRTVILNDLKIVVNSVSNTNIGLDLISSNIEISGCDILIYGSTSTSIYNYGINSDECNFNLTNTKITVNANDDLTNPDIKNICLNSVNNNTDDPTLNYLIQFFSCNFNIIGLLDNVNNYAIYTVDNYSIIGGNSNLYGNNYYNLDTLSKSVLKLNSCWGTQIVNNNLIYYPLSSGGVPMSSLNGNLFIGDNAGNIGVTGTDNTAIGVSSGTSLTSASSSTLLGSHSGYSITEGDGNTFIGFNSGYETTTGDYNTFTGLRSGFSNVSGNSNCAYGMNSLAYNTSGNNNSSIGYASGFRLTTGDDNTFLGTFSGVNSTTSSKNVFLGFESGSANTTGNNNVYIGYSAGTVSTTSSNNVALGHLSGFSNLANNNTFIGSESGYSNSTGVGQTMVGYKSGYSDHSFIPTGNNNTLLGYKTGYLLTSGSGNLISGSLAGYSLSSGSRNIILGSTTDINGTNSSGYSLTTGNDDVIIGANAGSSLVSGSRNVLFGSSAGSSLLSASSNILIGFSSGNSLTTQSGNILIGNEAGKNNSNSNGNLIMIGDNAGLNSDVNTSIFIGKNAGSNAIGNYNIGIGFDSLTNSSNNPGPSTGNVFIGHHSGRNITAGSRSVGIGGGLSTGNSGVLSSQTNQTDNTAVGYLAGRITTSTGNTLIGSQAGYNLQSGGSNSILGFQAGLGLVSGSNNVLMGNNSGNSLSSGDNNTFIGNNTGYSANTSNESVCVGSQSGFKNKSNGIVSIGYQAGYANETTAEYNVFIGYQAGGNTLNTLTAAENVFIGYLSGFSAQGAATKNILIGSQSGSGLTTGKNNIMIGDSSGSNIGSGEKNIFIGPNSVGQNTTNVDNNIFIGDGSGNANVSGIKNVYIGTEAGYNAIASNNIFMGFQSGFSTTGITGKENIYIGTQSAFNNTDGGNNICIGNSAGSGNNSNSYDYSILIGNEAGLNNQQDYSLSIGYRAGFNNTFGDKNINIGANAGHNNTTGNNNINIGANAGYNSTTSSNNIFIGPETGVNNTSGTNNILLGANAGNSNSTGNNNIFMGYNSGTLTTTNNNIMIGSSAGESNIVGSKNIFIGYKSGQNATSNNNIFLGNESGLNVSTGEANVFMGSQSGVNTTTGTGNVFLGFGSGFNNTIGNNSMFVGYESGYNNVDGNNCLYLGYQAGYNNISGNNNLALGYRSQKLNTVGNQNMTIGNYSLYGNEFGNNNMVFGTNAVSTGDIGDNNIIVGIESSRIIKNPAFQDNIINGFKSNFQGFASKGSIIMGSNSVSQGMGGQNNIIFGIDTAVNLGSNITQIELINSSGNPNPNINKEGYNIIAVSPNIVKKGQYLVLIYDNNAIYEPQIVYTNSVVNFNVSYDEIEISTNLVSDIDFTLAKLTKIYLLFGQSSTVILEALSDNNYIISKTPKTSLDLLFSNSDTLIIQSLSSTNNQSFSIISTVVETGTAGEGTTRINIDQDLTDDYSDNDVIYLARFKSQEIGINDTSQASSNIIIGNGAGNSLTVGSKNTAIGDDALRNITAEKYNAAIGTGAGFNVKSDTNFLLGTNAGYNIDYSIIGNGENTMIGFAAGYFAGITGEASNNLFIGNRVGQINQGSNNIFIGNESELQPVYDVLGNTTHSNKLAIYKSDSGVPTKPLIGGDLNDNKVGILTMEPKSSLDVKGSFGKAISNVIQFSTTLDYSNAPPYVYGRYWDRSETTANILDNSDISNFNTNAVGLINDELIIFNVATPTSLNGITRGVYNTQPTSQPNNSTLYDIGAIGYITYLTADCPPTGIPPVDSTSGFASQGVIFIGNEFIQYNGKNGGLGSATRGTEQTTPSFHPTWSICHSINNNSSLDELYNTPLTVPISNSTTNIPFDSGDFPVSGNIIIDAEIISYPDNTLYLFNHQRGTNSTTATSHNLDEIIHLVQNSNTPLNVSNINMVDGITAGSPYIKVDNLNDFVSGGYVIVEDEIIQYSSVALIEIQRGTNFTTPALHGNNSSIRLIADNTDNLISNTLDQLVLITETQIIVNDAVDFPSSGTILIDSEIIFYSSRISNILYDCLRGQYSTTTTTHSYGARVYVLDETTLSLGPGSIKILQSSSTTLEFLTGHSIFTPYPQGTVIIEGEIIKYSNNNFVLYNLTRGFNGTPVNNHLNNLPCYNFGEYINSTTLKNTIDDTQQPSLTDSGIEISFTPSGTVLINQELITYTGGIGIINVTRGIQGTTPSSHLADTVVYNLPLLGLTPSYLTYNIESDEAAIPIFDNSSYSNSGIVLIDSEIIVYYNKNTFDNIQRGLFSSIAATHSELEKVYEIKDISAINSLADRLPQGADTIVLQNNTLFSGTGTVQVQTLDTNTDEIISEVINYAEKGSSLVGQRGFYGSAIISHGDTNSNVNEVFETNLLPLALGCNIETTDLAVIAGITGFDDFSSSGYIRVAYEVMQYSYKNRSLGASNRGYRNSTATSHLSGSDVYNIDTTVSINLNTGLTGNSQFLSTDYSIPINDSTTSYPSSGTVIVGGEIINYGSKNNSLVLNDNSGRGFYGSTAATHNSGISVSSVNLSSTSANIINSTIGTNFIPLDSDPTDYSTYGTAANNVRVGKEIIGYTYFNETIYASENGRGMFNSTSISHTSSTEVSNVSIQKETFGISTIVYDEVDRIILNDTSLFDNSNGHCLINLQGTNKNEIIRYTSKGLSLAGCNRGQNGTIARAYSSGYNFSIITNYQTGVELLESIDDTQLLLKVKLYDNGVPLYPTSGYLAMEQELIKYDNINSSLVDVTRGYNGTIAESFSTGIVVNKIRDYDQNIKLHNFSYLTENLNYPFIFENIVRGTNGTTGIAHATNESMFIISGSTAPLDNKVLVGNITASTQFIILDNIIGISVGDTLIIETEFMLCDGLYSDINVIHISQRGYRGTTAVSHSSDSNVFIYNDSSIEIILQFDIDGSSTYLEFAIVNPGTNLQLNISQSGTMYSNGEFITYSNTKNQIGDFTSNQISCVENNSNLTYYQFSSITRGTNGTTAVSYIEPQNLAISLTRSTATLIFNTLNSTITSTDNTITLVSGTSFPLNGGTILIEKEIIKYTSKTGNSLNGCTRGYKTFKSYHPSSAKVYLIDEPYIFYTAPITGSGVLNFYPSNSPLTIFKSSGTFLMGVEILTFGSGINATFTQKLLGCQRSLTPNSFTKYTTAFWLNSNKDITLITGTIASCSQTATYPYTVTLNLSTNTSLFPNSGIILISKNLYKYTSKTTFTLEGLFRIPIPKEFVSLPITGDLIYYLPEVPRVFYINGTSSSATTIEYDLGPGNGVEITSGLIVILDEILNRMEFVKVDRVVGYNKNTHDSNTSFLINYEILNSTQNFATIPALESGAGITTDYYMIGNTLPAIDLEINNSINILNDATGTIRWSVIDSTNTFAYFGSNSSSGSSNITIHKINLSTFQTSTLSVNIGTSSYSNCAVIDKTNTFLYFGTSQTPAKIIKIALSTFTVSSTLTLAAGNNELNCCLIDSTNTYAYFGTYTSPGRVIKLTLSTFTVLSTLTLTAGRNQLIDCVINSDSSSAFFTANSGHICKINLTAFTSTEYTYATYTNFFNITINNTNILYVIGYSSLQHKIIEVNSSDMAKTSNEITTTQVSSYLNQTSVSLYSLKIDTTTNYAYVCSLINLTNQRYILKINLSNYQIVDYINLYYAGTISPLLTFNTNLLTVDGKYLLATTKDGTANIVSRINIDETNNDYTNDYNNAKTIPITSCNYTATTITATNIDDIYSFSKLGGYVLLAKYTNNLIVNSVLLKYTSITSNQLFGVSLVGTTTLSASTTFDRIIYIEANNNMIDPIVQPLLSLGTNTITQSIKNLVPLGSSILGVRRDGLVPKNYFITPAVNHTNVERGKRNISEYIGTHLINSNLTRINSTVQDALTGNISTIDINIPLQNGQNFGDEGIIVIINEFISYNNGYGFYVSERGALNTYSNSHTLGSSYSQYNIGTTTTLRKNVSMSNSDTNISITSNTGLTSGSLYLLTSSIPSLQFEIVSGGSWNKSIDIITRSVKLYNYYDYIYTGSDNIKVYSLNNFNSYASLQNNITNSEKYISLLDYNYLPLNFGSIGNYILIDQELIKLQSRYSLDIINRNRYITETETNPTTVQFITSINDYSTLTQNISQNHIFLPLNTASSYPSSGLALVYGEWINYNSKNSFDDLTRGQYGTTIQDFEYDINMAMLLVNSIISYRTLRSDINNTTQVIPLNNSNTSYSSNSIILIDNELIKIKSKNSFDFIDINSRGAYQTQIFSTTDLINNNINQPLVYSLSKLRNPISNTALYVPVSFGTASSYSSNVVLLDGEFINWTNKNTLDGLIRGQQGTSDISQELNTGVNIVAELTGNLVSNIYSITLEGNKVLLSDETSGIRILESDDINSFPSSGIVEIDDEKIFYGTNKTICDITRGTNSTQNIQHTYSPPSSILIYLIDTTANTSLANSLLTIPISENTNQITLDSVSGFGSYGSIIIGTEIISYTNIIGTTLQGCSRGRLATFKASHSLTEVVYYVPISNIVRTSTTQTIGVEDCIIYLASTDNFTTHGTVLIISNSSNSFEIITYLSKNALGDLTRGYDSTTALGHQNSETLTLTNILLTDQESTLLVNTSTGSMEVNLPSAVDTEGRIYTIKKTSASNNVLIKPYDTELIDNLSSETITRNSDFIAIQSDGTNWKMILNSKYDTLGSAETAKTQAIQTSNAYTDNAIANIDFPIHTTDDLIEGITNLYYTNQRVIDVIGGFSGLYDPIGSATQALTDANTYTDLQIVNIKDGVTGSLDTLDKIANSINNDANFNNTMIGYLAEKLNVVAAESLYANKDYLSLGVFARSSTNLYDLNTDEKRILILSSTYWDPTVPDPTAVVPINSYLQTRGNLNYNKTTGIISGLNINKTYKVEVSADLNYLTVSAIVNWEINLKNNTSGSLVNFNPKLYNSATQSTSYSGISMKISAFLVGCSSFTLTNRTLASITVDSTVSGFDSSYLITVSELA